SVSGTCLMQTAMRIRSSSRQACCWWGPGAAGEAAPERPARYHAPPATAARSRVALAPPCLPSPCLAPHCSAPHCVTFSRLMIGILTSTFTWMGGGGWAAGIVGGSGIAQVTLGGKGGILDLFFATGTMGKAIFVLLA